MRRQRAEFRGEDAKDQTVLAVIGVGLPALTTGALGGVAAGAAAFALTLLIVAAMAPHPVKERTSR